MKALFFLLAASFLVLSASAQTRKGFDVSNSTIPLNEILDGGPAPDGIPSIDAPQFVSVKEADRWLKPGDRVIALTLNGESRAYPIRILVWHEIVNDHVGDRAVAVTYCPLCGTAMIFDASPQGRPLEFGVSGLLYQSDVLMYDRESESLWSQLMMEAVSGPQVGTKLTLIESYDQTWKAWKDRHPEGKVLSRKTGHPRNYNNPPYEGYEKRGRPLFPVRQYREDLEPMNWVAGVLWEEGSVAFPIEELKATKKVKIRFKSRVLEAEMEPKSEKITVRDGETGETLPVTKAYWFAWQAFYPETGLYLPKP